MTNPRLRIDNLPMDRRNPVPGQTVYERREVDPAAEEFTRRTGSTRQAQYSQALGLTAPALGSYVAIDDELNLSGNWSVGFSAKVGDIVESTTTKFWTLFFAGAVSETDTDNSVHCYLGYDSGAYKVFLKFTDSTSTEESVTPITVTAGDDVDILITKSGTTVTLNVDGSNQSVVLSGSYTVTATQAELLGTHKIATRPKGTAPVIDNFHIWGSVVTTAVYQDRAPSGSPFFAVLPGDIGGTLFEPATSTGKVFLHPAPPDVLSSAVHFSGFGGALRIPYRSLFGRYFQTATETVGSQSFSFRVKGQRRFRSAESTLIDFGSDVEGFVYLHISASGNPVFEYNGNTVTSSATVSEDTDFEIFCGADGTSLFLEVDGTADTLTLPADSAPFLDFNRIPDLYIGNDEDPSEDKAFHGSITTFQFFDYGARKSSATAAEPVLDLDFSGDIIRDKSINRVAVETIAHATTEGRPFYAQGPLTDQPHASVIQETVVGPAAVGYTSRQAAPITSDASGVRAGDRAFVHSGDHVHVLNSELLQARPLGLPEPGADISCRAIGTGALDGVYSYGYRWLSQDGTYGPTKRLKPVKATGQASVLIGSGDGDGAISGNRELGESYGRTPASANDNLFRITDSGTDIWSDIDGGADAELTVETYARFPDFGSLEETVFDRGVTADFTSHDTIAVKQSKTITIDPNDNFTLQWVWRYSRSTVSSAPANSRGQGILAIGEMDPAGATGARAVMAYLDEDSTYGTEDGAAPARPRLVVARSTKAHGDVPSYRYLIFNSAADEGDDSNFWVDGHDYNFVLVREGDDLRVHIHDKTNDTWKHFTGGECQGFFANYNFPQWYPRFRAGQVAFQKVSKTGRHFGFVADLPTANSGTNYTSGGATGTHGYHDATSDTGNILRVGWSDRQSYLYHARAWTRAWSQAQIVANSEKRYAAEPGGPMDHLIKSDVGFFAEGETTGIKRFWDRASNQYWEVFKGDTDAGTYLNGYSNPPKGTAKSITASATELEATVLKDTGATFGNEQYRLIASSINDGTIVLHTTKDRYEISKKTWNPAVSSAYNRTIADVGIDPSQFNWYTTAVNFTVSGTGGASEELELEVKDLYINGNKVFDTPLGNGGDTMDLNANNFITFLGGLSTSPDNSGEVHIGEFRLWNTNRYDDPSETFDFLTGRALSEASSMYIYATFQPSDEVTASTLLHRGTANATLGAEVITISNDAELVDTRAANNQGQVTDPAPAVGIPKAPYPWITGVQLFRSFAYPLEDPNDSGEVQRALEAVQGRPLFSLAILPAGDASYVDIVEDAVLGYESPEPGSGFVPLRPNGVCIWQNQLALFRGNNLYFSERGPYGWESFPSWATYAVPTSCSGSDIVAAAEIGSALLVAGKSWATLLTGAPSNPQPFDMGGGSGVQSSRALTVHGGAAYGLGAGKLWRAGQDGSFDDTFSLPVHDLLPTTGRLAVSGALASLLVIDEDSDQVLRYHFPTSRWSIEERDALAIGDQGTDYLVVHSGSGAYSKGSAVYGDDVNALTTATSAGTIASASTVTLSPDADPQAPAGTRVLVVDSSGNEASGAFTSYSSPTVTVTADLSSLSGTCTIYYGVGTTGEMLDSGPMALGDRDSSIDLTADVTGDNFEHSTTGTMTPGDKSDRSGFSYVGLAAGFSTTGFAARGRYVRTIIRNRAPEASRLGYVEVDIANEQQS